MKEKKKRTKAACKPIVAVKNDTKNGDAESALK